MELNRTSGLDGGADLGGHMRNVLAVIRESAGLAQDLATLAGGKTVAASGAERLSSALSEVQRSIIQGAALSEAMVTLAYSGVALSMVISR